MAKDFANRTKPRRASSRGGGSKPRKKAKARKSASRRVFHGPSFSAGIVLGAAIVLLGAYAPEWLQETADGALAQKRDTPKPAVEFKFDEKLRSQEIIANPDAYASAADPSLDAQMEYLIQAASFQQRNDADTLRAELLLSGLPATTNAVRVGDKPWYRVTVGPFPSNVESGRAMTKLRELNLDAFLIKREISNDT